MNELLTEPDGSNFATLSGNDAYARYFNQLHWAFSCLMSYYRKQLGQEVQHNEEVEIIMGFFTRLLTTIEILRLKYSYHSSDERSLYIDVSDSGFPNSLEIGNLQTDSLSRKQSLDALPAEAILKRTLVDALILQQEPLSVLQQLSQRSYLEMLEDDKVFLPFTFGGLKNRGASSVAKGSRSYLCWWGCYDFATSRPYIHIMYFDQDETQPPLEDQKNPAWIEFFKAVQGDGSRAPELGVLAMRLDEDLETIHPKVLKRLCLGPIYSQLLLEGREFGPDSTETMVLQILQQAGRRENDGLLFFEDQIVFSGRQEVYKSLLGLRQKVREIFVIPEAEWECYKRRASVVHRYLLLPHWVMQQLTPVAQAKIQGSSRAQKITYDEQGEIHGI